MHKTILVTGSTDGIGLATAKSLVKLGHTVLLHGRNEEKLAIAKNQLLEISNQAYVETYTADLSILAEVKALAANVSQHHQTLDALINNAGVYVVPNTVSADNLDVRFVVNTIAPYLLTQQLLPLLNDSARVVNLSSAAQASLTPSDLTKPSTLADGMVYAQSKLALTMWSRQMAESLDSNEAAINESERNEPQINRPAIIAINPGSFLGSKMVQQAYGVTGNDVQKGADILVKAALSEAFANASGLYFDNDSGQFSQPLKDATDPVKNAKITNVIEEILARYR